MQVNDADNLGRTALHYACLGARRLIVRILLSIEELRCVHERDVYGYTALMYVAMRRPSFPVQTEATVAVARAMIRSGLEGASVDDVDELGYTPLMMACRSVSQLLMGPIIIGTAPVCRLVNSQFLLGNNIRPRP